MPLAEVDAVIVGVGYVGLPLAAAACAAGLSVIGLDIDQTVVDRLNRGESHVPDVSDEQLTAMLANGFTASTDPAALRGADTIVLCVPTGLDEGGGPDLGAVRAATATVADHLRPGTLVVLESTSYPGTTDEVVRPVLERTGLVAGTDFLLAYSPERIDPGNRRYGVRTTPKIVSGHTPRCAKQCAAFYGRFVDSVVLARGTREAEMSKLLENTYRYVNIALVNEIAVFCDQIGLDVWDVLHCAATKPFGFASFVPGPGVGGHCIPVDPMYLLDRAERAGFSLGVVQAARRVDAGMPSYIVRRAARMLGGNLDGATVLLLGATYKPDVPDTRETRTVPIAAELAQRGAVVRYHDPLVGSIPALAGVAEPVGELEPALRAADLTILLTPHGAYRPTHLATHVRLLLDTTGRVPGEHVVSRL